MTEYMATPIRREVVVCLGSDTWVLMASSYFSVEI
jgi:hypothetical protein